MMVVYWLGFVIPSILVNLPTPPWLIPIVVVGEAVNKYGESYIIDFAPLGR
jgi:hypothetical protein